MMYHQRSILAVQCLRIGIICLDLLGSRRADSRAECVTNPRYSAISGVAFLWNPM